MTDAIVKKLFREDRVEEGLVQNADVEVDVDEVLEVDVLQWTKTMSKRKAKSMSMLEVDAKRCHLEGMRVLLKKMMLKKLVKRW